MKSNYHTHTYRCKHAEGDIEDFLEAAREQGLTRLGFSEHMPLPDDQWAWAHMDHEELAGYIERIRSIDDAEVTLLAGGECEYIRSEHAYYEDVLLGEHKLDYLLGAPHWIPCGGQWSGYTHIDSSAHLRCFSDYCVHLIESGLFTYIAHPDVFMVGYRRWDENAVSCAVDIIDAAIACEVPLEFNANGLRKKQVTRLEDLPMAGYPDVDFWQLAAERGAKAVIGSDAHAPGLLTDSIELCEAAIRQLGIELVDPLVE